MDLGFEPGVCNHPVVVLSPMLSAGELTSFGGTSLVDKFPTETKARGRYLPIKPSAPHPDNKILLELCEAEDRLTKDSYVHISKVLRAKLKALRPYVSHRLRTPYLSDNSYRQLIRHAQYSVPGQSPRSIADYGWTLVLPPSQTATRPQRSRYDIPDRPLYSEISSPGRPQTSFSYSQTSVTRQARYNERAPLLPSPQPANPPRPALTRRIWERITHAGYSQRLSIDWIKVFGFFWALVIIIAACYGIYWLVEQLVQLVAACWLWLQHAVTHMVAAIKNWFGNLLGHGELI
ncbi:hypothetical protein MGU_00841 [Metarhizium guizhouense ARSEF 977]|uniref:Uncharacterized protein n=1 Tax=Metarhizium guizhouense (strain ARSEF 977) TaxID=1276136 RepID=A0A0B4GWK5_METGA|nr:hypothetical protein MGU_00841 [Metarhizium guizhouense ARSEF 977]